MISNNLNNFPLKWPYRSNIKHTFGFAAERKRNKKEQGGGACQTLLETWNAIPVSRKLPPLGMCMTCKIKDIWISNHLAHFIYDLLQKSLLSGMNNSTQSKSVHLPGFHAFFRRSRPWLRHVTHCLNANSVGSKSRKDLFFLCFALKCSVYMTDLGTVIPLPIHLSRLPLYPRPRLFCCLCVELMRNNTLEARLDNRLKSKGMACKLPKALQWLHEQTGCRGRLPLLSQILLLIIVDLRPIF